MLNYEIAKIFYEIADFLEMEDVQFKPAAYRKVALALEVLEKDIADIYIEGGKKALDKEVPGVGESIAKKIEDDLGVAEQVLRRAELHGQLALAHPLLHPFNLLGGHFREIGTPSTTLLKT